jgi:hypothetical protein
VELKELRGTRVGFAGLPVGHRFAAAMRWVRAGGGYCGIFGDGYCIYTVFACRLGGVVLDSATLRFIEYTIDSSCE